MMHTYIQVNYVYTVLGLVTIAQMVLSLVSWLQGDQNWTFTHMYTAAILSVLAAIVALKVAP